MNPRRYTEAFANKHAVYKQVQERLKQLLDIRALLRSPSRRESADLFPFDIDYLSSRFQTVYEDTLFRLDTITSTDQARREMQAARGWLVQMLNLQARHLPRENLIRILRFAIEKAESDWTDMERLYMALTDEEQGDSEMRMDYVFALVIHFQYATKHAHVLGRLRECDASRIRSLQKRPPQLAIQNEEAVRKRIQEKLQACKLDHFACAVPVTSITSSACEDDHACPICRNDYLDFTAFDIEDLISDYPVKIKFCGHVIGKDCLETWMSTPLADPAKYPYRACPLCRTQIEFEEDRRYMDVPECVQEHTDVNGTAIYLAGKLKADEEDCWSAILRLMSEEIVAEELLHELNRKMKSVDGEDERLVKARTVLEEKLKDLGDEKLMWGFDKVLDWAKAKKEWMNAKITV